MSFRIRNWSKYQHYRDRNPPWIKLHVEILSSEDWVTLDDASRLLAVVCMMVAAKCDGIVPNNPAYIRRVAYLSKAPNLKPLVACGFLEPLANASEMQANARPEKETEKEKEKEKETETETQSATAKPRRVSASRFDEFWAACPKRVGKGVAENLYAKACESVEPDVLIGAMRQYARSQKGVEEKYIAHPRTWLSQRRWEDMGGNVIRPSAFNSPEEQEAQRRIREAAYGNAQA